MSTTLEARLATEALEIEVAEHESGWQHVKTLRHEDGSVTVIKQEEYVESWMSPREYEGNVAILVQCHRDYIDLDEADNGIQEARDRWGDESPLVERYVRMFRPDVAHYVPRWEVTGTSQGDWQWGWGYVLVEDMERHEVTCTAKEAFDVEMKVYGEYFAGEVYYGLHLSVGEPIVAYGDHGAYVAGYVIEDESCGGFLGYEDMADIGWQFTSSPVLP